jgi:hypothetical protein
MLIQNIAGAVFCTSIMMLARKQIYIVIINCFAGVIPTRFPLPRRINDSQLDAAGVASSKTVNLKMKY